MALTGLLGLPRGRPFTVDDVDALRVNGHRYELIGGTLCVSPAPTLSHQKIVAQVIVTLGAACPSDMHVLPAPFLVRPSKSTELQPDVLVARETDLTEKLLPVAPMLAVEVLSPNTALYESNTKKAAYELLGVPSYWMIDPKVPSLTVFELDDEDAYQTVAKVEGKGVFEAQRPFAVRVVPVELLGTLAEA